MTTNQECKTLIIGITGSRNGMTPFQQVMFLNLIHDIVKAGEYDTLVFKHGDCVGADAQVHEILTVLQKSFPVNIKIEIHPPVVDKHRAFCKGADKVLKPRPYLDRNRAIVNGSNKLIAIPDSSEEKIRSGTWATVRYARRVKKSICLIIPEEPEKSSL